MFNLKANLSLLKCYLNDPDRLKKTTSNQLLKFRERALKNVLDYAYAVPLYHSKFREKGIKPCDIKGFDEIEKIPIVSKKEIIDNFPNGIISKKSNINIQMMVSTSGSTGQPMKLFKDTFAIVKDAIVYERILREYNHSILKNKISHIGDISVPYSSDETFVKNIPLIKNKWFNPFGNIQYLYCGEPIRDIVHKLEMFQPQSILAYPGTLRALAQFNIKHKSINIHPSLIISGGGLLDDKTRKLIEESFQSIVVNHYVSTEGGVMAFECKDGNLHVQSDFVNLETIDNDFCENEKTGNVVLTRLYTGGTPLLRYSGMNDIIQLDTKQCNCTMNTPIIKKIEGRTHHSITLADGRILPPATITLIPGEVMDEFNLPMISRFQIIQNALDEIEIALRVEKEFNNDRRKDKIFNEIKSRYRNLFGPMVSVSISEIDNGERNFDKKDIIKSKTYFDIYK